MTAVSVTGVAPTPPAHVRDGKSRLSRVARWTIGLGAVGLEIGLIAPRVAQHGSALGHLRWMWLVTAVLAEAISVIAVGMLYQPLLRAGGVRVTRRRSLAVGAAASGITAMVPGGAVASSAFLYRQFRQADGSAALAGWAVAATAALSLIGFTLVTGAGAAIGDSPSVAAAASTGGLAVLGLTVLIAISALLANHARSALGLLRRSVGRVTHRHADPAGCDAWLDRAVLQLSTIRPGLRQWCLALSLAALTWAADLACFALSLKAVGADNVDIRLAALAYAAGLATTSFNVLPAGIGTVEAGMMLGLAHGGVAAPSAVAGILTYRLVAYVLVGLSGWAVWAGVKRSVAKTAPESA